jgi:hypothetical protein
LCRWGSWLNLLELVMTLILGMLLKSAFLFTSLHTFVLHLWLLKHETLLGRTECVLGMMSDISCKTTILPVDKDTPWIIDSFKKLNMNFVLLSRRLEDNNLKAMS